MAVERVDLIQLHNLVEPAEFDEAFAPGGAVEALAVARDEGLVGHIGVTGHGLRIAGMHLRSLERFDFASVLLPVNFILLDNPAYRADVEELLGVCADRGVAVQTIKSIARGRWADENTPHFSWYDPLTDPAAIGRAVRFVLSQSADVPEHHERRSTAAHWWSTRRVGDLVTPDRRRDARRRRRSKASRRCSTARSLERI